METARKTKSEDQRERLNSLYRFQRHFYDVTRRFFLFGRDELLREMNVQPNESVLEVGCGTGRNLIQLSLIQPNARLFGLDAADEMLKTAGAKLDARNKTKEIVLRQGLAEEFSYRSTFHRLDPFDRVFISYSLSMFPNWQEALRNALDNLKSGGSLHIVDFFDGVLLPVWLNRLLRWWLALFKVRARPEVLEYLKDLREQGAGELSVTPVGRRYAFIEHFRKS